MKDFGFDGNCDKFPVGMAYVPGSSLTKSVTIWKKASASEPSFLNCINRLQEGDV